MPPNKLFVVADDFGYCEHRDRGIAECITASSIDSTSLLITGRCAALAVERFKSLGANRVKLGLHFNMTEGAPLSDVKLVPTLLTNSGAGDEVFRDKLSLRDAARQHLIYSNEVRVELSAQIKAFWNLVGTLPCRVDGHQHAHIVPGVSAAFSECLREFGIRDTRLPYDAVVLSNKFSNIDENMVHFNQTVVKECISAKSDIENHGITYPPTFVGLTLMGFRLSCSTLSEAIAIVNSNVNYSTDTPCHTELMVHPGYPSNENCNDSNCGCRGTHGPDRFSQSSERSHELDFLKSAEFHRTFRRTANS